MGIYEFQEDDALRFSGEIGAVSGGEMNCSLKNALTVLEGETERIEEHSPSILRRASSNA